MNLRQIIRLWIKSTIVFITAVVIGGYGVWFLCETIQPSERSNEIVITTILPLLVGIIIGVASYGWVFEE